MSIIEIVMFGIAVSVAVLFAVWLSTFRRSYSPEQGEYYVLSFFGTHLFVVCVNDGSYEWYQRLPFYLLFWPFNTVWFTYQWVDDMTYSEYLKKKEEGHDVRIEWQPEYKTDEIGPDRRPLNQTVEILVERKERMRSLKKIETFNFASEFETKDNYRGDRIITLFLEIKDMSTLISRIHDWQRVVKTIFNKEHIAWSKTVNYPTLRTIKPEELDIVLGKDKVHPFIEEINEEIAEYGFIVKSIQLGNIYFKLVTRNMLDAQETKTLAKFRLQGTEIDSKGVKIAADAEAYSIQRKGNAEASVLGNKAAKIQSFIKNSKSDLKELTEAKYGEGVSKLPGVYFDSNNGMDTQQITNMLASLFVGEAAKKPKGGTNENS